MTKIDKLKFSLLFQASLVAINVYGTFVNIGENKMNYAAFTAAVGIFCFIGVLAILADIIREKNG